MRRPKKRFKRSVIGLLHKLQTKEKSRTVPWLSMRHYCALLPWTHSPILPYASAGR